MDAGEGSALAFLVGPPLGWVLAAVWGALWGSFFNVAIYRIGRVTLDEEAAWDARTEPLGWLAEERLHLRWMARALASVASPSRSFCPTCRAPIRASDNVPVVSWLLLRGRCRACGSAIAARYPLVELASLGLALAIYARFAAGLAPTLPIAAAARFFVYFAFAGVLLVLTAIDLDSMYLPDAITYPAIPLFFLAGRALGDVPLVDALAGMAVGYGGLRALDVGWRLATGRDGMGGGDAKLLAMVGALCGWRALPYTLFGAAVVGLVVMVPVLVWRRRRDAAAPADAQTVLPADANSDGDVPPASSSAQADAPSLGRVAVPFGPFLAAAALGYLLLGRALEAWVVALVVG